MTAAETITTKQRAEVGPILNRAHDQRLRRMYRSAGWPCLDPIEIELLAAGMLERIQPLTGTEYLRVTDAGIQRLSVSLVRNRAALDLHDALVERVAAAQVQQGRIAYLGLMLLAKPEESWLHQRPDVFSIRNTTVPEYVEPIVFEIKVKRADLKTDLKKPEKRAGYIAMSSECYYVLAEGIAKPEEIPPECGVIIATATSLDLVRPAPKRAMALSFGTLMVLAKSDRFRCARDQAPEL